MNEHDGKASRHGTGTGRRPSLNQGGYVLLETVVATALLMLGLAVMGAQVQDADSAVREMDLKLQALALAEMQLAHLDTGLIEIDSMDEVEEEKFGPRYPNFAWRLTTEETITEDLFRLKLEILYERRDDFEDDFDFDEAEVIYHFHVFRARPKGIDFEADFGLREDELEQLADQLSGLGLDGLGVDNFDPSLLAKLDSEELIAVLPSILDAFGMDIGSLIGELPQEVRDALEQEGLLDGEGEGDGGGGGGG